MRHRIAGIKKWPSKAKRGACKHRIVMIKKIRYRTPKRKHPDDAIPIADTDIVVAPASPTSAQTDMNSLPPEMLLAIFDNLDSVQQQAIMRYSKCMGYILSIWVGYFVVQCEINNPQLSFRSRLCISVFGLSF